MYSIDFCIHKYKYKIMKKYYLLNDFMVSFTNLHNHFTIDKHDYRLSIQ